MNNRMDIIQQLGQESETIFNPAVKSWKERGGKVVGVLCSYIPEEIIAAAGLLPVRMRATGSFDTTLGDTYLCDNNCSFARHCLSMALAGGYDFLDGVVIYDSCDHIRRLYDVWHRKLGTPFQHYLNIPRKSDVAQVEWYREELVMFKDSLEKHFGVKITDERLRESIRTHNVTRELQRELYALRTKQSPPISGVDTLNIIIAGTVMPKDKYNGLLKELLVTIGTQTGRSEYKARLMIVGGMLDDPGYLKIFENLGGLVVTDLMCFGARDFWHPVDEMARDPLEALAKYHVCDRIPCARMVGLYPRTLEYIKNMVSAFKVDGVVFELMKFCDVWGAVSLLLRRDMREAGIPFLVLEREYLLSGVGQLKTRIQAFLETMGR